MKGGEGERILLDGAELLKRAKAWHKSLRSGGVYMNEGPYEVGLWFVHGERWVVESDVDDSVGASSESAMVWRYDVEPRLDEITEDLFIAMEYMREQWLMCGLGLPDVEVVIRHALGEVWRERWEW